MRMAEESDERGAECRATGLAPGEELNCKVEVGLRCGSPDDEAAQAGGERPGHRGEGSGRDRVAVVSGVRDSLEVDTEPGEELE